MTTIYELATKLNAEFVYDPNTNAEDAYFLDDYPLKNERYDVIPFIYWTDTEDNTILELDTKGISLYAIDYGVIDNLLLEAYINYVFVSADIDNNLSNHILYYNKDTEYSSEKIKRVYEYSDVNVFETKDKIILIMNTFVHDRYVGRFKDGKQSFEDRNDKYSLIQYFANINLNDTYIINSINDIIIPNARVEYLPDVMERSENKRGVYVRNDLRRVGGGKYKEDISVLFDN